MTTSTLQSVNSLYDVAINGKIERIEVSCETLRAFSKSLKHLAIVLGDAAEEEIWKAPSIVLKRFFHGALLAPLPFNQNGLIDDAVLAEIATKAILYKSINPNGWLALERAASLAGQLREKSDNPLFSALIRAYPLGLGQGVLLLKDSRFVTDVENLLRRYPTTSGLRVVTAGQLKGITCEKRLVIVGPSSWHPDYVIQARRALDVAILKYDWLHERPRDTTQFQGGWGGQAITQQSPANPLPNPNEEHFQNLFDLLPAIDWSRIHATGSTGHMASDIDNVPARLVVLEGGRAVFLENDPSATVLLIDLEAEDERHRVARSSARRITPGKFIVLRSSGDGDYIVSVANKLMGAHAQSLRALQLDWKERLRTSVRKSGLLDVSIKLLDLGSIRAGEQNVRNWMSIRNIRTNDESDFSAIMRLIGLENLTREYWNSMEMIARYHQRAGQQIRRQLLRKLRDTDLTDLERLGRLDISLPEAGTGALTAFRIVAIEETPRLINVNRLNQPFSFGGIYATHASG